MAYRLYASSPKDVDINPGIQERVLHLSPAEMGITPDKLNTATIGIGTADVHLSPAATS